MVGKFGVKYVGLQHFKHLVYAIAVLYPLTIDWEVKFYCVLALNWYYNVRTVDIIIPGYILAALHKFQHPTIQLPQHSPCHWNQPKYGAPTQLAPNVYNSSPLPPEGIQGLQQITGTLLYYVRAIDTKLLVALGTIGSAQSKCTVVTAKENFQLLNYCSMYPGVCIRYKARAVVLYIHSDASYLLETQERSCSGRHFYLSDQPQDVSKPPDMSPMTNGPLHTVSIILSNDMASAAEVEVGALFVNSREGTVIRTTLIKLGHPQPATPI